MTTSILEQDDDFQQKSAGFILWFSQLQGMRLSPKIQIADMRSRRAGRGIGNHSSHLLESFLMVS